MSSEIRRGSADDPGETGETGATASAPDNTAGIHLAYAELCRQDLPEYDGDVPPPLEGADPGNEDIGEPAETTGLGEGYHSPAERQAWLDARDNAADTGNAADGDTDSGADATGAAKPQDNPTDANSSLLGLKELQDVLIKRQGTLISRLETDNDRLRDDNDRLRDGNAQLKSENDSANAEIKRLKAELADARKDKPAEQPDDPDGSLAEYEQEELPGQEKDGHRSRRWHERLRMPSKEALALGNALTGVFDAIAANTHLLTSGEATFINAVVGAGVLAAAWGRAKWEKRKNADKPED